MKVKMKKSLLAVLAMGSVASVAHADVSVFGNDKTNVDFYGILDAAYGKVQHSLKVDSQFPVSVNPFSAVVSATKGGAVPVPGSVTGLFNGGISDSRLGAKGSMDFGNGINAFFTLEEGINVTTLRLNNAAGSLATNGGPAAANGMPAATTVGANSSLNGQLFNRQAFVGLSDGHWGSLAVGRNYAPIFDIVAKYDPVQTAQLFSPFGFSGTYGGGGGVSEDARVDKSLKYTNKIGSYNFGALYKFSGTVGDTSAKSGYTVNGGYEEGNIGIQAAYEVFNDALKGGSGAVANTVSVTNYDTKAFMLAAKYKINDAATVKIGYESYTLNAPSDAITLATTNYYSQIVSAVTNYASSQTTHIMFVGGDYNFTEKFNLAAGLYDISPQQSADAKLASGDQRCLSLLADYHFTKALDAYAGMMYTTFSGNAYPSSANAAAVLPTPTSGYYQSNQVVALGARFKF